METLWSLILTSNASLHATNPILIWTETMFYRLVKGSTLSNFKLVPIHAIVDLFELHCWGCIIQCNKCIYNKGIWGDGSIYGFESVIQVMKNCDISIPKFEQIFFTSRAIIVL